MAMAAHRCLAVLCLLAVQPAASAAGCRGEPEMAYRAQSPLLATQPDTALELRVHGNGCVEVDYPRQQGGGSRMAHLDAPSLLALRQATARGMAAATSRDDGETIAETETVVLDADLVSLYWRQGPQRQEIHWQHGGSAAAGRGAARTSAKRAATLGALRREFEHLAETLRDMPR